jgi:putative tricarboxylic transport membrane protein
MMTDAPQDRAQNGSVIRSPVDFAGGLFLMGIAAVGYAGAFTLPFGQLSGIGSGLLPKVVAVLVAAFGALLLLQSFVIAGDRLERWAIRGPIMVLGAVAVFAFTVRSLGLVVAGPLCFIVSALADRDTRPVEAVVSAVIATLACGFLFKDLLNLPIPFDPMSILGPLHAPYDALKSAAKALVMGSH